MTDREQDGTDSEVDGNPEHRATGSAALDRTAEPRATSRLDRADETAGDPGDLLPDTVELLHRCMMAPRHVVQMLFCDVCHLDLSFCPRTKKRVGPDGGAPLITQGPTEDSLGTGLQRMTVRC